MPASSTPARPTVVLALVAAALVATLLVRTLRGGGGEDASAPALPTRGGGVSAVASGAPAGEREAVAARFKAIVDADPFKERSFKRRPAETPADKPAGGAPDSAGGASTGPGSLSLRLTGIVAQDQGYAAILEDRGAGKGLFVRPGDKLGPQSVASVGTDAILVEVASSTAPATSVTTSIRLGDKLDVKADDVVGRLASLGPVSSASGGGGSGPPGPLPQLTDDQKMSVLERLKAKRRQSLGGGN